MSHLHHYINSAYVAAANRLEGQHAPRRVLAYVESYDDVLFWQHVFSRVESPELRVEILLPSRSATLQRGKKAVLANRLGPHLIACVDADYDVWLQSTTPASQLLCASPYVLHTYYYAIESFQCHAQVLHSLCVMATLNDSRVFDFEGFLAAYSRIIHPLLIWNIWCYRYGVHTQFSLSDFARIVALPNFSPQRAESLLSALQQRVHQTVSRLQRSFPQGRKTWKPLQQMLTAQGLTPETAYLYMRGHDLYDGLVAALLASVCTQLCNEREREIVRLSQHAVQQNNELAAYRNACAAPDDLLRKHTYYDTLPAFRALVVRAQQLLNSSSSPC